MNQFLARANLDDDRAIRLLYDLGHFWSPGALRHGLVSLPEDLDGLTLDDDVVRAAVRSYQEWFKPDLDRLTLRAAEFGGHERMAAADGDIGPATAEVLTLPRCGVPDYAHPEADPEANWPETCRNDITTSFRMTLSGLNQDQLVALWVEADGNWARALQVGFRYLPDEFQRTRFWAVAEALGGSILAYHTLAVNNCSAVLKGAYNSRTTWTPPLFLATVTHEHGHGLGFQHVSDPLATMYASITQASMSRRGYPNASDLSEARRNGYEVRTSPPPSPPPLPPPVGGVVIVDPAARSVSVPSGWTVTSRPSGGQQ